jgi:ribosomal protein S18 acetylase RimI-like enzyme
VIRPLRESDLAAVRELVEEAGDFRPDEVESAAALARRATGEIGDYFACVMEGEQEGSIRGYACFGPVPNSAAWDLYWIAVESPSQRQGWGSEILRWVEADVLGRGGEELLIETSGAGSNSAARAFYERHGYLEETRIKDFTRRADRIVYSRRLR